MKQILNLGLVGALLAVTACQKPSSTPTPAGGGVAVIDLDKVATAMGWLKELSNDLQSADAQLKGQLDEILKKSLRTIEDAKKSVAADAKLTPDQVKVLNSVRDVRELEALPLTKDQRDHLTEVVNGANATWQKATSDYQQTMQTQRASLVVKYRETVRPVAKRVATSKGFNIVMVTSDNVLWADQDVADITGAVIEEFQRTQPAARTPVPSASSSPITSPATR